jgi:hypothetical protein
MKLKGIKQTRFSFFSETNGIYFCVTKPKNTASNIAFLIRSFSRLPSVMIFLPKKNFLDIKISEQLKFKQMKTTIKSAVIGLVALTAVNFASATTIPYNNAAELKLVGHEKNQPVYQLQLNNQVAEEVVVVVMDDFGIVLHREVLKGVNITRSFQLDLEDLNGTDLKIKVYSRISNSTVSFAVNDNASVVLRSVK